jgi:hypothetical protein
MVRRKGSYIALTGEKRGASVFLVGEKAFPPRSKAARLICHTGDTVD